MDNNIIFEIINVIIEKVNSIKYLGFIIDKQLEFNDHMEFICKKIGEKNWIFRTHKKQNVDYNINKYLQYDN